MSDRKKIFERISTAAWNSGRWVLAFDALESMTFETVYPLIVHYVRDKFLLSEEDGDCAEILGLADISLMKIRRLRQEGKLLGDVSQGCSGAASVVTKKVLLMKAIQDDFHVRITPAQSAAIQTLEQLTQTILAQRGNNNATHL